MVTSTEFTHPQQKHREVEAGTGVALDWLRLLARLRGDPSLLTNPRPLAGVCTEPERGASEAVALDACLQVQGLGLAFEVQGCAGYEPLHRENNECV